MTIVTENGSVIRTNDRSIVDGLSDHEKSHYYDKAVILSDDLELEPCWVATVCRQKWGRVIEYEFVGEEIYDHEPTKEELLYLMASLEALRHSYVTVDKAWQLKEEDG